MGRPYPLEFRRQMVALVRSGRTADDLQREMARALVLSHNAWAGMKELIFDPLDKEMLGAIRAPTPPLQRLIDQLDAIRTFRASGEAEPPHEKDEPVDYHPPLRERLANLGFATVPDVECRKARPPTRSFARPGSRSC